ncbi:Selenophosphate-dependent tRNA 2-selenouridine synthase [Bathymodiolus brooksi thiotrophic gill symbiont]|jgi:tRNA 2-selenouridine synthase|nr:Selenophosphate-dependent tRNA 2-selenouridine synthase [Bathymodiolus brooksi thiotrophic gill symbiont]
MPELTQITDFTHLFSTDTPLIDSRAPVEFKQGAFPYAQNLILMSNDEREQIGTCYKNKGQAKAIELGHQLVQGKAKDKRIEAWLKFIKNNPNGALYCFRGGLRSQIAQQWIYEATGIDYPRIAGGYKALRRFLIEETERIMQKITPVVIGGQTGCGKTLLLDKLNNTIDLEGLANHRGSAFGNTTTPQPTQINFENTLAIELIKQQHCAHLIFEDEGANIGANHIPDCLQVRTKQADLVLLEVSTEQRLQVSMDAYVIDMCQSFMELDSQHGFANFANYWLTSLEKIQKRLGLERYQALLKKVNTALSMYQEQGEIKGFYSVIEALLVDYYDPMYNYQIQKKMNRVVFKGNAEEVLSYLSEKSIN